MPSTSGQDRYGRMRVRARKRAPTYRHLRPSSQTDSQLTDGPYVRYLRRVAGTLGAEAFDCLCEIDRPGLVGDLLLAKWVVPYEFSPERVAFRLLRAKGRDGIQEDPETVRHIYRFADLVLGGSAGRAPVADPSRHAR